MTNQTPQNNEVDPRWTRDQIELGARIYPSDVNRAMQLIQEGSPELAEMVRAPIYRRKRKTQSS